MSNGGSRQRGARLHRVLAVYLVPGALAPSELGTKYPGTRQCGFAAVCFLVILKFWCQFLYISSWYNFYALYKFSPSGFFLDDHVPTVKGREKCRVHRLELTENKQEASIHLNSRSVQKSIYFWANTVSKVLYLSTGTGVLYRNHCISAQTLLQGYKIKP